MKETYAQTGELLSIWEVLWEQCEWECGSQAQGPLPGRVKEETTWFSWKLVFQFHFLMDHSIPKIGKVRMEDSECTESFL